MPRRSSATWDVAAYTARDLRKSILGNWGTTTMSRTLAIVISTVVAAISMTSAASAGCYNCYAPPPCQTCYQQQYVQPQYRTVDETVMVSPGATVAHRTAAQYRTVMVPQTVMVAPPSVQYERIPPQYATRQRVEMVSPGYSYYAPVQMGCASCGY
ncbi:hypothetical protein CT676_01635 [Bradyrhizobium sp. MOS001]|nr:hypothetical protein CT676_01635 [Bradyrhizobium sp. MOS001]